MVQAMVRGAAALFAMAFEETNKRWDDKGPIWNFFYHCRNAAVHNGRFAIWNISRFPAEWRGLVIDKTWHEKHLFSSTNTPDGKLGLGDPLLLLHDIEQEYIERTKKERAS